MPEVRVLTKTEIEELLEPPHWDVVNRWLERGDGIAVYENVELGNPELGHKQFVSFGSPASQLPSEEPPSRMPDIGTKINWRYWIFGIYRGEKLGAS